MSMLLEIEKEVFKNFPYGVASMQEIIPLVQDIMGEHWTNNSKHSEGAITTAISRACETSNRNSIVYEDTFYKVDKGIYGLIQYKDDFNKAIDREKIINKALERRIEIIENVKTKKEEIINKAKVVEKTTEKKVKRYTKDLKELHYHTCQVCGKTNYNDITIGYIRPLDKGGKDTKDNKMVVCEHCKNKIKDFEISANLMEIAQTYSRHEIAIENIQWYIRHKTIK